MEITTRALRDGILDTQGQTPQATMESRLYVDTKRANSHFRRVSRGVFGLVESQSSDISQRITTTNRQTRTALRKQLMQMPPDRFEALIGELLLALGFEKDSLLVLDLAQVPLPVGGADSMVKRRPWPAPIATALSWPSSTG